MTGSELARVMIPRTANLIVGRDPGEPESASVIAARSEPRPESLRVVTTIVRETGFVACAVAPPAGAATATAAAAETPHFSSSNFASSAASKTVRLERSVTIFCRSAMILCPRF